MEVAEAQEFTESLGQVFSGGFRLIAHAHRQGVPKALGMTTPEWVNQSLGGYVKMGLEDRRQAVAELTENGMTNVAIADVLGVSTATVERDKRPSNDGVEDEDLAQEDEWYEEEPSNDGVEDELETNDQNEDATTPNHKLHAAYAEFALRGIELREILLTGASFGTFVPDNHLTQLQETIQLLKPLLKKRGKAAA